MATTKSLLGKLDRCLFIQRRPGDDDPTKRTENIYGDRTDDAVAGSDDEQQCWGAYEMQDRGSGEDVDAAGRNAGTRNLLMFIEPAADVRRTDRIVERADPDDPTSAVLHTFDVRAADLLTTFKGVDSHWEILAVEHL
jgi:hypothetical protein